MKTIISLLKSLLLIQPVLQTEIPRNWDQYHQPTFLRKHGLRHIPKDQDAQAS